MSLQSSRQTLVRAQEVLARARVSNAQMRVANSALTTRLGRPPSDAVPAELRLCHTVAEIVPFDRVSVSLLTRSLATEPLQGSDPSLVRFEDQQHTIGEGPEPDALLDRRPVYVADLARAGDRWPFLAGFGDWPAVHALGVLPLGTPGLAPVGFLTVARDTPGPFSGWDFMVLPRLADAVLALVLARPGSGPVQRRRDDPEPGAPLDAEPFGHNASVPFGRSDRLSFAAGVLGRRHHVEPAAVIERLRIVAVGAGVTLPEIAEAVVRGDVDPFTDGP